MTAMVRTQIQLTAAQMAELRQLSAESGRAIADLVREGVEAYLRSQQRVSRQERITRALEAAGKFASGSSDISVEHDRYLAEAFGE